MCAPRDPGRRGIALLIAVAVTAVVGLCTLALWRTSAGSSRALLLERARTRAGALTSDGMTRTLQQVSTGAWRTLATPGANRTVDSARSGRDNWLASLGRPTWSTLLVRVRTETASGARAVGAHRDERVLIPLLASIPIPVAALTGERAWSVPTDATVEVPVATPAERVCRRDIVPVVSRIAARGAAPRPVDLVALDADTVTQPLVGSFLLRNSTLTSRLQVNGMVVIDSGLVLRADLLLMGVLFVRGSIYPAGGLLDVTGAVVAGDSLGGNSGLGSGDRVRYDACAIRRAVDLVTRPAPPAMWTRMSLF